MTHISDSNRIDSPAAYSRVWPVASSHGNWRRLHLWWWRLLHLNNVVHVAVAAVAGVVNMSYH